MQVVRILQRTAVAGFGRLQKRTRSGAQSRSVAKATDALAVPATGVYVHLPFCRRRCFYCDFPIQVVGDSPNAPAGMITYVDAVCKDIATRQAASISEGRLETVFFGGGTPSLLPPAQLSRILDALDLRFGISADAEVSLECDPGTFDSNRLREYLALGVTRISLGVQSFDETMLRVCGRAHNAQDARSAVEIVRESSVRSWSLDLISGLPNLTPALWDDTLDAAIAAAPHHLSVYDLQVEDKTAFGRWYTPGVAPLPSEEQAAGMYVTAHHTLQTAGFQHYEVSNFAVAGHKCRHNLRYWSDAEWHAFGLAAANNLGGQRFTRPRRMAEYLAWVADGCATPALVSAKATDAEEALQDCLMLGLRLVDGVRIPDLRARFGDDAVARVLAAAQPAVDDGLMLADEHHLRLAAPRGFLVSTSVLADLFANMERRRAS